MLIIKPLVADGDTCSLVFLEGKAVEFAVYLDFKEGNLVVCRVLMSSSTWLVGEFGFVISSKRLGVVLAPLGLDFALLCKPVLLVIDLFLA